MKTSHCKWPFVKLGDYVDLLAGFAFKSISFTDNASDIPLVKGENLHQGFIDWEKAKKWPSSEYEKHKTFQLEFNDVVLAMDRPWIEAGLKFSWIRKRDPKSLLVQRVARLRGRNGLLSEYLRFIVGSPGFTDYIKPIVTGVNVPHISGDQIRSFRFCLPPLPTQRKIAAILSAYDDLIENNLRRIKMLEEMAQNLYREWFVKFRFPGHEQTRFIDSPIGRIPEGWEFTTLGMQLSLLESGKRPKGGIRDVEDGVPSIGAENIKGIGRHDFASEKFIPREFFQEMRKGVVRDRDVAIYKDGAYIGKSSYFRDGFPHSECCVNEHVFLLRTNGVRLKQNALYLWLQEPDTVHTIHSTNANAAQPGINRQSVGGLELILPDEKTAAQFDQFVEPLLAEVINLAKQVKNLRRTRDLLLPRLISGEVDVSELDITIPEEAV